MVKSKTIEFDMYSNSHALFDQTCIDKSIAYYLAKESIFTKAVYDEKGLHYEPFSTELDSVLIREIKEKITIYGMIWTNTYYEFEGIRLISKVAYRAINSFDNDSLPPVFADNYSSLAILCQSGVEAQPLQIEEILEYKMDNQVNVKAFKAEIEE